jgi:hypothetical protein
MKSVKESEMSLDEKNYYLARGYALIGNENMFSKYYAQIPSFDPRKPDLINLFIRNDKLESKNLLIRSAVGLGAVVFLIFVGRASKQ